MTCIIGMIHENKIYMGCDSAGVNEYGNASLTAIPKVFKRWNDSFIFGYSGSFRLGQILQYSFPFGDEVVPIKTPDEYMIGTFVGRLRDALNKEGFMKKENNLETMDANFLVGVKLLEDNKPHLYCVQSDLQCTRFTPPVLSIGSGYQYALGAMTAYGRIDLNPMQRIEKSLEIAALHCSTVRGPFHVESI